MNIEDILKEVKAICVKYKADRVLLFGSFAKGTENKYSDVDIAVSGVENIEGMKEELNQIMTLRSFDLVDLEHCNNEFLVEEIEKYGREIL